MCLKGLKKTTKTYNESWFPAWNFNKWYPEYKEAVLTIQPHMFCPETEKLRTNFQAQITFRAVFYEKTSIYMTYPNFS